MRFLLLFIAAGAWAEGLWRSDLDGALAHGKQEKKPVLIDFQAPWCYSCYYMDENVLSKAGFAEAAKGLIPVKVDVDTAEGKAQKEKYRVTFLPTYILVAPDGATTRIIGEQLEKEFLDKIQAFVRGTADDPRARALRGLRERLAANEYEEAANDLKSLPALTLRQVEEDVEWKILRARLELMRAVRQDRKGGIPALQTLLALEEGCELAYDVSYAEKLLKAETPEGRKAVLEAERGPLERLVKGRILSKSQECADFRTGIQVLTEVYKGLGLETERATLLRKALARLEGGATGEDKNRDDNLRFFLELAGEDKRLRALYPELAEAYPSDYVYPFRFGRYLQEKNEPAAALEWIEKADKLSYGSNRLAVTNVRAKVLTALGRRAEAKALLEREIKAGKKAFAKEAAGLEETLEAIATAP